MPIFPCIVTVKSNYGADKKKKCAEHTIVPMALIRFKTLGWTGAIASLVAHRLTYDYVLPSIRVLLPPAHVNVYVYTPGVL